MDFTQPNVLIGIYVSVPRCRTNESIAGLGYYDNNIDVSFFYSKRKLNKIIVLKMNQLQYVVDIL